MIDSLCNMFTPDRRPRWESAPAAGVRVKVRQPEGDSFVEPSQMIAKMDELGIATLILPVSEPAEDNFTHHAARAAELEQLAARWPGRFAGLAVIDPRSGSRGVHELRAQLAAPWMAGCYIHTHTWDRRFDHADYYPYYQLCADLDLPIGMQAGTSGGFMPSECGHPIGIDKPALYFREVRFVLSHTGWPWVSEAIAMALKFPNVYLSTASYPPAHWNDELRRFIARAGRGKVMYASNFPTTGQRRGLAQLEELKLSPEARQALLHDTARRVYSRLM